MQDIFMSDIEATGLMHQLIEQGDKAKLHNLCVMPIDTGALRTFHADTEQEKQEINKFLDNEIILVMHNGICYDKSALNHFGYDVSKVHFVDTLALSWYLDLNREKHGLEAYGEEAGVPKPVITDWSSLTQEDYDNRVQEDVKIQLYVYKKLKGMFEELYGRMSDYEFCTHKVVKYLNFKMEQLAEQQNTRFKIDVEKAKAAVKELSSEIDHKKEQLKSVMPKVPVYTKHKRPAKPFLKNGDLSATGLKWKELCDKAGVDFDFDGEIKRVSSYDEPNPASSVQLKEWLFQLGWQPAIYKFVKSDEGERKIPQIYKAQSGGQICDSIELLAEQNPQLEHLVGLSVLSHRKGCIQGFLDSLIFGDSIEASAAGFTNTLRLRHRKPCVNLPSSKVSYSEHVRGCLIAREMHKLLGADLSSLENRIKFNLQLPYDRKFVMEQMSDDFDPHLAIAKDAGLLTQAEVDFYKISKEGFPAERYLQSDELLGYLSLDGVEKTGKIAEISNKRAKGKTAVYSCQYGAGGARVAQAANVPLAVGKVLVKAYKRLNWSIPKIANDQVRKTVSHGTYQLNPYNGIWYHLKFEKDSFSTLVQGTGSYVMDLWLKKQFDLIKETDFKKKPNLLATFHDEQVTEFFQEDEELVKQVVQRAMDGVNAVFKLEIPFACDIQVGSKYSEIH